MRALFRVDASLEIGSGHVMRCLTLANSLRKQGYTSIFICREHRGHMGDLIRNYGYAVHLLPDVLPPSSLSSSDCPPHLAWLGSDWEKDAEQTAFLAQDGLDLVVVDHYALDIRWERKLRPLCKRILVIDDLADREHDCDFLLDQNLIADRHGRYAGKVPAECSLMLGPKYALLQPLYADLHDRLPLREGAIRRVLIYFGGADTENLTGMALSACHTLSCHVDVVLDPSSPHIEAVRNQVQSSDRVTLYERLPTLAGLMAKADLAIGAGGATSWERCCLGLPSLVITLAENQKPITSELNRQGIVRWLGHKNEVVEADLIAALKSLVKYGLTSAWSAKCAQLVDGRGVRRVCELLTLDSRATLLVKPATRHDEAGFLESIHARPGSQVERRYRHFLRDLDGCRIFSVSTQLGEFLGWGFFRRTGDFWELASKFDVLSEKVELRTPALRLLFGKMRSSIDGPLRFKSGWSDDAQAWLKPFAAEAHHARQKKLSLAICSDQGSWINEHVPDLILYALSEGHEMTWTHSADEAPGGDLCFYLSYGRIVDAATRARYQHNLVVHASDLPKGRGWSPASWLILEGAERVPVTLLAAVDKVDAGPIYLQEWIDLKGTELVDDWRSQIAQKTIDLARKFLRQYPQVLEKSRNQVGEPSAYPRRRTKDSMLDLNKTIAEQINLLRIVDNDDYPAFFIYEGKEFVLRISSH